MILLILSYHGVGRMPGLNALAVLPDAGSVSHSFRFCFLCFDTIMYRLYVLSWSTFTTSTFHGH